MNGECMFCGQGHMFEEDQLDSAFTCEPALERVARDGHQVWDHIATCLCDCQGGREYAYRFASRKNAYEDIEYLLGTETEIIPVAKGAADLILDGEVQNVTFKFDKCTFKVMRGKDSIKVEKTITTKESLES